MSIAFLVEPDSASAEPLRALRLAIEARSVRGDEGARLHEPAPAGRPVDHLRELRARRGSRPEAGAAHRRGHAQPEPSHDVRPAPSPGLVEVLRDRLDPWQVTHTFPSLGGLHVMTAGALPAPGRRGRVAGNGGLLEKVYEECEAVVLDSPPVLTAADASGLASHQGHRGRDGREPVGETTPSCQRASEARRDGGEASSDSSSIAKARYPRIDTDRSCSTTLFPALSARGRSAALVAANAGLV